MREMNQVKWNMFDVQMIINECDRMLGHKSDLKLTWNARLKSTLARYITSENSRIKPTIEFGIDILNVSDKRALTEVVKHEYAHYYSISVLGTSKGHDKGFREVCKAIGLEHDKATCSPFTWNEIRKARGELVEVTPEMEMDFYNLLKKQMQEKGLI